MLARHHLRGGEIHGIEAGSTEAIDLHARHLIAVTRRQRGGARNVAASLADRIDAAEDDVVDQLRVEMVAQAQRGERARRQPQRRDFMQRAVRLAASARRAHMVVDESVGHGASPQKASAGMAIMVAAPVEMRARCAPVSGIMRSMKNCPAISLASMIVARDASSVLRAIALSAMRAHI